MRKWETGASVWDKGMTKRRSEKEQQSVPNKSM